MVISVQLELEVKPGTFSNRTELVDSFSENDLKAFQEKYASEGNIHSWSVSERLPYDEGYQDAMSGKDSDKNPYTEHFWKHDEWWKGWDSFHESNS